MLDNTITTLNENRVVQNVAVGTAVLLAVGLFLLTVSNLGLLRFGQRFQPEAAGGLVVRTEGFQFAEEEIFLQAGSDLELAFMNDDVLPHSFDVDELDIHVPMGANDTAELVLNIAQPGTYTFYCAIPGHREAGMVGTLIVAP